MKFEVYQDSNHIDITLSATLENIDRAVEVTKKFLAALGLNNHAFAMILGIREALINAVVHGCGKNSQKNIAYGLRLEAENLIVEVNDDGPGFNWHNCLTKKLPTTEDCGRGLAIMKQYFSKIQYNQMGNQLRLVRKMNVEH